MRTAGIVFCDREAVLREARAAADAIRSAHPEVRRVFLYGSLARGSGGPRSDIDLVVIIAGTPLPPRERAPHFTPVWPRPLDVTVYTEAEVARFASDPPPILRAALTEGLEI